MLKGFWGLGNRQFPRPAKVSALQNQVAGIAGAIKKLLETKTMSISHNRHSVGGSNYHLQFTPKYRKPIFKFPKIRNFVKVCFQSKARQLGILLTAVEFGPDHVHLFVENCKNYSVSQLAKHFKGYSSRMVRKEFWDILQERLWGNAFWSSGYFHESIGSVTENHIKFYIERQQKKHWMNKEFREYWSELRKLHPSQKTLYHFSS